MRLIATVAREGDQVPATRVNHRYDGYRTLVIGINEIVNDALFAIAVDPEGWVSYTVGTSDPESHVEAVFIGKINDNGTFTPSLDGTPHSVRHPSNEARPLLRAVPDLPTPD